jgi:hypothetical protein
MPNIILILLIILIVFIIFKLFESCMSEGFSMYNTYQSVFPWWNGYSNFPFNNSRLGNTTNMSYDLRGDPLAIPRTQFPWNNSSLYPIYNQGI